MTIAGSVGVAACRYFIGVPAGPRRLVAVELVGADRVVLDPAGDEAFSAWGPVLGGPATVVDELREIFQTALEHGAVEKPRFPAPGPLDFSISVMVPTKRYGVGARQRASSSRKGASSGLRLE